MNSTKSINPWPLDADNLEIDDDSEKYLVLAKIYKEFLESRSESTVLAANKGMGKTTLLRLKRKYIQKNPPGEVIPTNQSFLDTLTPLLSTPSVKQLDNSEIWRDLWICSILLSIISHKTQDEIDNIISRLPSQGIEDQALVKYIKEIKPSSKFPPSFFLTRFIGSGIPAFQRHCKSYSNLQYVLTDASYIIFIDALDQCISGTAVMYNDPSIWISSQHGLLHALHSFKLINKHIKIFASIRVEAWRSFNSQNRANIDGFVLEIKLDEHHFEDAFRMAVSLYENGITLEEWCGGSEYENKAYNKTEKIFSYIYRHSVPTLRALMMIGRALHWNTTFKINGLKHHVLHQTLENDAAFYASYTYLNEMCWVMDTLTTQRFYSLAKLFKSNIFKYDDLVRLNQVFAKKNSLAEDLSHPFCELLNIGLLGIVKQNGRENRYSPCFKKPWEFEWVKERRTSLFTNKEARYVLHPSLTVYAENVQRWSKIIISNEVAWSEEQIFNPVESTRGSEDSKIMFDLGTGNIEQLFPQDELGILFEIIRILTDRIQVPKDQLPFLYKKITSLMYLEEEGVFCRSAFHIIPCQLAELNSELKLIGSKIDNTDNLDNFLSLAKITNYMFNAVMCHANGLVSGIFSYPALSSEYQQALHRLPPEYRRAIYACKESRGLLLLFPTKGEVRIFYNGDTLFQYKNGNWSRLKSIMRGDLAPIQEALVTNAAYVKISDKVWQGLEHLVRTLVYARKTALITIGDHDNVLRTSTDLVGGVIREIRPANLTETTIQDDFLELIGLDGAIILTDEGQIVAARRKLNIPANVGEPGRGTRHSAAAGITRITQAVSIAVSQSGVISIYARGECIYKFMP